jgi:hypothetical protein
MPYLISRSTSPSTGFDKTLTPEYAADRASTPACKRTQHGAHRYGLEQVLLSSISAN